MGSYSRDDDIAQLVRRVESAPNQTVGRLALRFECAPADLRALVSDANAALDGCARLEVGAHGYVLAVRDAAAYGAWKDAHRCLSCCAVPATPEERIGFLMCDLLARSGWIRIDNLSALMFCSRRTVSSDLKAAERLLLARDLHLERRPHYGVRVAGDESDRRICLAHCLLTRLNANAPHGGAEGALAPGRPWGLDAIDRCVERSFRAAGFAVRPVAYQSLLVHIAVALGRLRSGHALDADATGLPLACDPEVASVARDIARALEGAFGIPLPDSEISYIALHLASKRAYGIAEPATILPFRSRSSSKAVDAARLADEMVRAVREAFRIDLTADMELKANLARHIGPLAVRLAHHMNLVNPLLDDIRARYALAFAVAGESARVLVEALGHEVGEDEVGYLALSFALALERRKMSSRRPKNVLIVCASGLGSAPLLEIRCREEFGDSLGAVGTCDVTCLSTVDFLDIDCVIATVPIPHRLPVPVYRVGYFLDGDDVALLRSRIGPGSPPAADCARFLDPRLFAPHMRAATRDQAIDELCALAAGVEGLPPAFAEAVHRREAICATSFGNRVAMPHPITAMSARTFVAVGLFDEPVAWGDRDVQAVFLISVSTSSTEDLSGFYESMLALAGSSEALDALLADRRFECLSSLAEPGRVGA